MGKTTKRALAAVIAGLFVVAAAAAAVVALHAPPKMYYDIHSRAPVASIIGDGKSKMYYDVKLKIFRHLPKMYYDAKRILRGEGWTGRTG